MCLIQELPSQCGWKRGRETRAVRWGSEEGWASGPGPGSAFALREVGAPGESLAEGRPTEGEKRPVFQADLGGGSWSVRLRDGLG